MVHYTYVTYQSTGDGNLGEYFNWVMVTPDRNTANTYFRALQQFQTVIDSDVNGNPGAKRTFTSVDRYNSQFWTYDSDNGENFHLAARALCGNPKMKQVNPDFSSVFGKIRVYWIGAYADGRFRTFFPHDDGAGGADDGDMLSGYSFFVKRRGIHDYWCLASSGYVILASSRRSRFIFTILQKSGQKMYPKMPITDDDEVKIEVLDQGLRIPIGVNSSNQLVVGAGLSHQRFTFHDLKARFSLSQGRTQHANGDESLSIVTWTSTESLGSADSFEIIDGINLNETES
ncbi:uncharacterized protein BDW43DRAFT_315336 [Aspergillus alliaceus]|uniref:uncharacterized protein n=1 Tax=Petromyces alliaceus TaxID=209559 RepID=UPI0012A689DE|nr:uncharacterized protein BDW43DRAFT_315336 [Aspergillus alliaceus]KAB8229000.1 hypothetical protein BDW43DRAFT_315336 [Aspergillus alliaceus]